MPTSLSSLTAQLPNWPDLIRGSLVRYFLTCGQKTCRCHQGEKHGPYWYLSVNQAGKTRMRKLQDHQVTAVRRALKNYNRWWKTCLKIFELNTQIALSKEA
jgi:hypothetical protein